LIRICLQEFELIGFGFEIAIPAISSHRHGVAPIYQ